MRGLLVLGVKLGDLSMLSLFLIGDIDLSDNSEKAADVTGNNSVDLSDLARLKQFISKSSDNMVLGPQKKS